MTMPDIFKNSYFIAFFLLVFVAGFMLTSDLVIGGRGPGAGETTVAQELGLVTRQNTQTSQTDTHEAQIEPLTKTEHQLVRTQLFKARNMNDIVQIRGVSQANSKVAVRTETTALLTSRHVQKGQQVAQGDVLCTLDQGTRNVQLLQAEASLEQARADYQAAKTLANRGFSSANSAKKLQADFKAAQARRDEAQTELERTQIKAPIAGIVQDPVAEVGDMLSTGSICVTLVNLNPIKFSGQVSEQSVSKVTQGLPARADFVTGEQVDGVVSFVAASADAQTRSFPIEIEFPNPDGTLRDGVTTTANILVGQIKGHLVSQSLLVLNDEGQIGVRGVRDKTTIFYPVRILSETSQGVWVAGLPERAELITVGQEYTKHGQTVLLEPEETAGVENDTDNEQPSQETAS